MLKKLKKKFVLINMAMVGILVILVFSTVCGYTYSKNYSALSARLKNALSSSSETQEDPAPDFKDSFADSSGGGFGLGDIFGDNGTFGDKPENKPLDIESVAPSVVVYLDADGNILYTVEYFAKFADGSLEKAIALALNSKEEIGILRDMRVMYMRSAPSNNTAFVDKIAFTSTLDLDNAMHNTLLGGLLICAVVLLVMLVVSLLLSSLAIKPVGEAWTKQKQFIADASHELKTPLTVILANNNILQAHPDDTISEQRQWLESTQEEASRMKLLIDQMLFLAKNEADQHPVSLVRTNVSEITERSALSFEPVAFEKGVTINTSVSPDIIINSDAILYERLMHIFLDNAVKHADNGGTVTVSLHKSGQRTFLSVNNTGSFISDEDLPHIFDRFYRADKARTSDDSRAGYGLGLAIAKNILASLGGDVTVSSSQDSGTTFIVMF